VLPLIHIRANILAESLSFVVVFILLWTIAMLGQERNASCEGGGVNWPIQELTGRDESYDKIGYDICTNIDINLDGKKDLLLSSPGRQSTLVYFWRSQRLSDTAEYSYPGGGRIGIGDFNGDRINDMIVHQPGKEKHNKLDSFLVYYGRAKGTSQYVFESKPDRILHLGWSDSSSGFGGHETILAADFDNNGYDDISISFPEWYENPEGVFHAGKLCLIEGGDSITNENIHYLDVRQSVNPYFLMQLNCDDVNADSVPDYIYAVQSRYDTHLKIIYGRKGDLSSIIRSEVDDSITISSEMAYRHWGILDINEDGIADLIFPKSGDTLVVYAGTVKGVSKDPYDIWIAPFSSYLKVIKYDGVVDKIGDYTGDGYPDFAALCLGRFGEAIRVIYLGSPHGMTHMCETIITDIKDDGLSANQYGSLEDMTDNGIDELVLSVPTRASIVGFDDFQPGWVKIFRGRKGKDLVSVEIDRGENQRGVLINATAHPNPTSGIFDIHIESLPNTDHEIVLVDLLGRELYNIVAATDSEGAVEVRIDIGASRINSSSGILYALIRNSYTCTYVQINKK
jgi:hypothetical protein